MLPSVLLGQEGRRIALLEFQQRGAMRIGQTRGARGYPGGDEEDQPLCQAPRGTRSAQLPQEWPQAAGCAGKGLKWW